MLYRRGASIVDAIYLDGSEQDWRKIFAFPARLAACVTITSGDVSYDLHPPSGKLTAHPGQWLTYHRPTGTVRTFSPDRFHAEHEACS